MRVGWTAAAAVALGMLGGCAHDQGLVTISADRLGRLPVQDEGAVFTAQHDVEVAATNRAQAEQDLAQARSFRDLARSELDAAKARSDAASRAFDFAQRARANDPGAVRAASRERVLANRQVVAAQTKVDLADKSIKLRDAQRTLAERRSDAAQAELAYAQAEALRRAGIDPGVSFQVVAAQRDRMRTRVAEQEPVVAQLRDEAQSLRTVWQRQRRNFDLAQRAAPLPESDRRQNPMGDDRAPVEEPPARPESETGK